MGCLGAGLAALLALAVPASIARTSLIGAYVVITVLAAGAVAATVWTQRQHATSVRRSSVIARIGGLTVVYVLVVTVIHATG